MDSMGFGPLEMKNAIDVGEFVDPQLMPRTKREDSLAAVNELGERILGVPEVKLEQKVCAAINGKREILEVRGTKGHRIVKMHRQFDFMGDDVEHLRKTFEEKYGAVSAVDRRSGTEVAIPLPWNKVAFSAPSGSLATGAGAGAGGASEAAAKRTELDAGSAAARSLGVDAATVVEGMAPEPRATESKDERK